MKRPVESACIPGIELIEFGRNDIDNIVAKMSPDEIDKLTFGAIQLDASGTILEYNAAESVITGRDAQAAIGKNFFNDLAPCTNTPRFRGVFDAGVQAGVLKTLFEYTFTDIVKPTKVHVHMVRVHMKKAVLEDRYWIFVKRV